MARLTLNRYGAIHFCDQFAYNRKTQSGSAKPLRCCGFGALKTAEKVGQEICGDANTVVFEREPDIACGILIRIKFNLTGVFIRRTPREFDRVPQQIGDDLSDTPWIAHHYRRQVWVKAKGKHDIRLIGEGPEGFSRSLYGLVQIDGFVDE